MDFGTHPGFWKLGAKFTSRDKDSDAEGDVYDGLDGDLTLDSVARSGPRNFLGSVANYYTFGPRIDYRAAEAVFREQRAAFERSDLDSLEESLAADYSATEDIAAGYVMAGAELGSWSLVGGVRVERTDAEYSAFDLVFDDGDLDPDAVTRRTGENDYTNYLPSLHAQYLLQEDLIIRGAWTNTIGRPAYESLVPLREFEIDPDGDGGFEGSVVEGNPDLDPLESMNFDLSVEWYPRPAGLISLACSTRTSITRSTPRSRRSKTTEFEGRFFSELSIERPRNAVDGQITGIEINLQQQFTAWPAPFDGFGASASTTPGPTARRRSSVATRRCRSSCSPSTSATSRCSTRSSASKDASGSPTVRITSTRWPAMRRRTSTWIRDRSST
jgi:TonB-dependent receptor